MKQISVFKLTVCRFKVVVGNTCIQIYLYYRYTCSTCRWVKHAVLSKICIYQKLFGWKVTDVVLYYIKQTRCGWKIPPSISIKNRSRKSIKIQNEFVDVQVNFTQGFMCVQCISAHESIINHQKLEFLWISGILFKAHYSTS